MIVSLYAAILTAIYIAMIVVVVKGRTHEGVAMGDAGKLEISRCVRAHANFAEYAPLFIVLLALTEAQGLSDYLAHALGVLFVVGRVLHAYSLLKHEQYSDGRLQNRPVWRIRGMALTMLTLGVLALLLLAHFFRSL